MQKQDEIAFAKQLNDFEASMQKDLNQRSSEIAKKWEFDFSLEKPLESATNDAASMKKMQWSPFTPKSLNQFRRHAQDFRSPNPK